MKTLEFLAGKIRKAKSVLIFCHVRPDGDTIGSAFALKYGLESLGIKGDVVCDSDYPSKLMFLPYASEVYKPEKVNKTYDLHIAVDVASENLLGGSWSVFRSNKNVMCIDHHLSNERYVEDYYVDTTASASMIVYKLLKILPVDIDVRMATGVLLGIVTDTHCFTNPNTDAETLKIASETLALGADYNKIVYETRKVDMARAKLLGEMVQKAHTYFGGRLFIMVTTQEMLAKYGLKSDANEGFVEHPLLIAGVVASVSLLEDRRDFYRVSFRSRGAIDVNKVAREFGGGGHINASGCVIRGSYEEVIERILRAFDINSDWEK